MDHLLTMEEAAGLLRISRSHAYALAARDALPVPVVRVGGRVFVRRVDVEELLGVTLAA